MKQETRWLTAAERDLLIDSAFALLDEVGLGLKGSASLARLAEAGAVVDEATSTARFPQELARATVAACPRSFTLGAAVEELDVTLAEGEASRFCPGGCGAFVLDDETGERRPSTLADLRSAVAVLDELPELDVLWTPVSATDLPLAGREVAELGIVVLATRKHVVLVESPTDAAALRSLAAALAGDLERFAARPRFSTLFTVASPLRIEGRLLDIHAQAAAFGSPVFIYSVTLSGATAPVTPAGTVAQTLAEVLGGAVAVALLAPGAKVVPGPSPTSLDMQTGQACYASPEAAAMAAACVEVIHHLGLPVSAPGMATEAKHLGVQAGFEKGLKGLTVAAAGADLLSGGIGMIGTSNTLSLPQIVVDGEIAARIRRMTGPFEVSPATILRDRVAAVGVGGNFLGEPETRRRIRAGEHLRPVVSDRQAYEAWRSAGRTELDKARDRVRELLEQHERSGPWADDATAARVREVCGLAAGGGA
ncbi:MAG: trimethylamine methyltransferase family protein [Thermoleophilia bacterium]|jgi:trimethylamine--corrinoid protein Co-methyltransferase|nr:trimethylamine methyltransferase family protein [Thermoleophilia bacterium]